MSTFLIGGFNDRPTARDNAAFAYSVFQISDAALLMAAAFSLGVGVDNPLAQGVAALGLIVAASIKSSQLPLSGLFLRSMEGASPNSALGYAGIFAHANPNPNPNPNPSPGGAAGGREGATGGEGGGEEAGAHPNPNPLRTRTRTRTLTRSALHLSEGCWDAGLAARVYCRGTRHPD